MKPEHVETAARWRAQAQRRGVERQLVLFDDAPSNVVDALSILAIRIDAHEQRERVRSLLFPPDEDVDE